MNSSEGPANYTPIDEILLSLDAHIQAVKDGDMDSMIHLSTVSAPKLVWAVREAVAGLFRAAEETGEAQYFSYLNAVMAHLKEI